MPFPGDPRERRARPRHGFTPGRGYVENLQTRKLPPTDWNMLRNMLKKQIPYGIMNLIGYGAGPQMLFGTALPGLIDFSRYITGAKQPGYRSGN